MKFDLTHTVKTFHSCFSNVSNFAGFQEVVEVETVEVVSSLTDHDYIGEAGNTTNPSPSSEQATKPPISHAAVHEPCQCHARQLNRPTVVQEAVGPDMLPTQQSILSDVHMVGNSLSEISSILRERFVKYVNSRYL